MKQAFPLLLLILAPALAAQTQTPAQNAAKNGAQTRAWIELQASGKAAAPGVPSVNKPVPGEVADKVYQRYVDSFGKPLPESYAREGFTRGQQN